MLALTRRLLFVVLLVGNFSFSAPCLAQEPSPTPSPSPNPTLEALETQNEELKIQNMILEKELQIIKDFKNSILGTVWGALGVVTLVTGLSWFNYRNDKHELKQQIDKELEVVKKELMDKTKEPYKTLEKDVIEAVNRNIESRLEKIEQELKEVHYDLKKLEVSQYLESKDYNRAFLVYRKILDLVQHSEKRVTKELKHIESELKKIPNDQRPNCVELRSKLEELQKNGYSLADQLFELLK